MALVSVFFQSHFPDILWTLASLLQWT